MGRWGDGALRHWGVEALSLRPERASRQRQRRVVVNLITFFLTITMDSISAASSSSLP